MPIFSARSLLRVARAGWRVAPIRAADRFLGRLQQAVAMVQGYGFESLDDEAEAASAWLPPAAAVIFDVGAHMGEWSRRVKARRPGANDRFFLFEPSGVNIMTLRAIAISEFTILPYAVSDSSRCAPLFSNVPGSGIGSLHHRDLESYGLTHENQEQVQTTTLDAFTEKNGIERVDYIKLDVEGHELAVLRGAARLLRERRIGGLSFEFGGTQLDSRAFFRDYWKLLTSYEYRIHRLLPGGTLVPLEAYDVGLEVFRLTTYVALASLA